MLAVEIILIIAGVLCICASFFISKKKRGTEDDDMPKTGADLWTSRDEEVIIKHIDEILNRRGVELVETTEDQMNRICNEKIMAIDEFSKPVLDKIEANHEEVVFMYNMLGEKQKEIRREIEEDTLRKQVPPTRREQAEPAPESEFVDGKGELFAGLPVVDSENSVPAGDKRSGIKYAAAAEPTATQAPVTEKNENQMIGQPANVVTPVHIEVRNFPEVNTGTPIKPVDKVGESMGNMIGAGRTYINTDAVTSQDPKELLSKPPEAGDFHIAGRDETVEDKVRILYKQGKSVVDISKELNIGQGEVKLMIAMYKKRA
ncbi:MAG: hypothetical protein J6P16_03710 [Eubacterium sp.]|nr:hypothetical protein [Eubacterium sp.]